MEDEEKTYLALKGLRLEDIEAIIDGVKKTSNNTSILDFIHAVDKELKPYGWTYARYIEYFY